MASLLWTSKIQQIGTLVHMSKQQPVNNIREHKLLKASWVYLPGKQRRGRMLQLRLSVPACADKHVSNYNFLAMLNRIMRYSLQRMIAKAIAQRKHCKGARLI